MDALTGLNTASPITKSLLLATIITAVVYFLQRYLTVQKDPEEPPYIYARIPVIGHLLGIIKDGAKYYTSLEKKYSLPIYALPVLTGRLYMVTSPEWAQAIHRAHKTMQFNELIAPAMKSLFALDEPSMEIVNTNKNGEDGTWESILLEIHDMLFSVLAPGPDLDSVNHGILSKLMPDVNQLAKGGSTSTTKLWYWLRHRLSIAGVETIWGPRSPFSRHPEMEEDFWTFEASAGALAMAPYPYMFARKGYKARERLFEIFEEYVEAGGYKDAETSQLAKNRVSINMDKYGLSKRMFAQGECSLLFGALLNTIPTGFWLISHIFSDKALLARVRAEVDGCISIGDTPNRRIINVPELRTSSVLLAACFRETLRVAGGVNSSRWVAADTTVTNTSTGESYVLKKGSVVQIASNVIHQRSLWGDDPQVFDPTRFLSTAEKAKSEAGGGRPQDPAAPFRDTNGKMYSGAFRSFGGGNNICPGRHFAQTEILTLAAIFVAGFEIENVDGDGKYKMPAVETRWLALGVMKPKTDVEVNIRRRKGWEDVEFGFEM